MQTEARDCIQRKTWCMGPYAGVEYNNLTLSTPTHVKWTTLCQSRIYPQSGTKNLASGAGTYMQVLKHLYLLRHNKMVLLPLYVLFARNILS
jgi:hypothetical protein